jgi:outer membrane lipoprotein SlyB
VVGGVAGSAVGGSKGSTLGATVGAMRGGLGGAAAEEGATRQKGLEITVKLDSGRIMAITQASDETFRTGGRVRVLSGNGVTRVSH